MDTQDDQSDNPLTDELKEQIRDAYRNVRKNAGNFRDRPSQVRMIAEISRVISGSAGFKRIIVAEAPTGTGKSMAYLLGSIPIAKAQEKQIIVATGTVALQEQLVNRDIPSLKALSNLDFSFAIAKGRGRYACTRNLMELSNTDARQSSLLEEDEFGGAVWPFLPKKEEVALVHDMEKKLSGREWSGDLDEWKGTALPTRIKPLVVTDHGGCLGRKCPQIGACAFFKSREEMKDATVIVANHDLVMSDVNLGGGAVLPSPEGVIYIFDEAHHLPDVALKHGAAETNLRRSIDTLSKTTKLITKAVMALKLPSERGQKIVASVKDSVEGLTTYIQQAEATALQDFPQEVDGKPLRGRKSGKYEVTVWRFKHGKPPAGIHEIATDIAPQARHLAALVSGVLESMRAAFKKGDLDARVASKLGPDLNFHKQRLDRLADTWIMLSDEDQEGRAPTARWITRLQESPKHDPEFIMSCSPTSAADMLRRGLWDAAAGVVLTSATLTAVGTFKRFAERAGLQLKDGTEYLQLSSPFDHQTLGELYIPDMIHDPSRPDLHTQEVATILGHQLDPTVASLVLFSAKTQMEAVASALEPKLKDIVLIQGELQKSEILELHGHRIRAGKGSVIFGLASFAEGVDLPGKLCEHVFIAKIPFSVPDTPVDATYAEWLESVGRNPFIEISVPDASIKLVQACGRLIRTETDTGRVTLLDKRILTKRYGSQLLNALPPFRRVQDQGGQVA